MSRQAKRINKNIEQGIENLSCGGFLIRKTIQNNSLRLNAQTTNSYEFKNQSMQLFINKKFAEIRDRINTNKVPSHIFSSACLRIKQPKENQMIQGQQKANLFSNNFSVSQILEEAQKQDQLDKLSRDILIKLREKEVIDDFVVETAAGEESKKSKKATILPEHKLKMLLNQCIPELQLRKWYGKYLEMRKKKRFEALKKDPEFRKEYRLKGQMKSKMYAKKMKEPETQEECLYLVEQICNKYKIKLSKILNLPEDEVRQYEYNETLISQITDHELDKQLSSLGQSISPTPLQTLTSPRPQTTANAQKQTVESKYQLEAKGVNIKEKTSEMNKLLRKENNQQKQKLIEIFNTTRNHRVTIGGRNSLDVAGASKKMQMQDKMYNELQQEFTSDIIELIKKKNDVNPAKFKREHDEQQEMELKAKTIHPVTLRGTVDRLYGNPLQYINKKAIDHQTQLTDQVQNMIQNEALQYSLVLSSKEYNNQQQWQQIKQEQNVKPIQNKQFQLNQYQPRKQSKLNLSIQSQLSPQNSNKQNIQFLFSPSGSLEWTLPTRPTTAQTRTTAGQMQTIKFPNQNRKLLMPKQKANKEQKTTEIVKKQIQGTPQIINEQEKQNQISKQQSIKENANKHNGELTQDFNDFVRICEQTQQDNKHDAVFLMHRLDNLNSQAANIFEHMAGVNKNKNRKKSKDFLDDYFTQFKNEREFKKKLIMFMLNKVNNMKDLLSVYYKEQNKQSALQALQGKKKVNNVKSKLQAVNAFKNESKLQH